MRSSADGTPPRAGAPLRTAVVGHTEWITFADVDAIPDAGGIAHATHERDAPGGGGAVAAVQLARLAGSSDFFTAVGDDDIARRTRSELAALGVLVHAGMRRERSRRGLTMVDPTGERTIVTLGHRLTPSAEDRVPWERLAGADGVYVTAGDAGALAHARRARVMVVTSRILRELLATGIVPDALVGSARDPSERFDLERLPWRPRLVVRTEGKAGGSFVTSDGIAGRWEAVSATPGGDAYGAGDSFAAGLTFALARGLDPNGALKLAARCGAACASGRGPYATQLAAADL